MKITVDREAFRRSFFEIGRGNYYSHEAYDIMYDFLSSLEDETGIELELDPVAFCGDFDEGTPNDLAADLLIENAADLRERLGSAIIGETSRGTLVVYLPYID